MPLLDGFKRFFSKSTFDFDRPDICLYNFHPQLRIFLAFKGVFFNNRESLLRLIWPTYSTLLGLVGVGLESLFVARGLYTKDYSYAIECVCYLITIITIPIIYSSMFFYREKVLELCEDMNQNFKFVCSLGPRYRKPFLDGQLLIWKLCYSWLILATLTAASFFLLPVVVLIYQTLFMTQTEDTTRPLSFPMWLPYDDPYRTPNYEIFLVFEMAFCVTTLQTFNVNVYIFFHILLHCYYVMEMMILDFEVIFDGLDPSTVMLPPKDPRRHHTRMILNQRVKRIVDWHQSVFKIFDSAALIYGPILIYQLTVSPFIVCFIAYQIAEDLDKGSFNFLFTMLGACSCLQLWIPCYLGTLLRNKGFAVGEACWNCGWQKSPLGQILRTDIILIILRTQKPLLIQFSGITNVELETFSSAMSAAYSYFNLLRQNN